MIKNYKHILGKVLKIKTDDFEKKVYVLGTESCEFDGKVIAAFDNGDKWVVCPPEKEFYEPDIKNTFNITDKDLECLHEKTCGSIMYTVQNGVRKYLLIENESKHIGFPKGHVELGENEIQTAEREVLEETGLNTSIDGKFRSEYTYINADGVRKRCVYFASEYDGRDVKLQKEEISRSWLLPYSEALELLNYPQDKVVLEQFEGR